MIESTSYAKGDLRRMLLVLGAIDAMSNATLVGIAAKTGLDKKTASNLIRVAAEQAHVQIQKCGSSYAITDWGPVIKRNGAKMALTGALNAPNMVISLITGDSQMAKYKVDHFSSQIRNNERGAENIYLLCKLENSAGNSKVREYRVSPDVRHPDLSSLEDMISTGFNHAKATRTNVEITEYKERLYLFFKLPGVNDGEQFQVTGERL
ncbi:MULTISPECIES: hypothetical protein [unclassified Pseudomonas]|uniref:hypothetical protein n=1 Tax=unclassified Pseudomonas TaxID=196821 RepID=UPI001C467393|nr:hypothetical protein [Pseudomonas sp. PAMC 26793]